MATAKPISPTPLTPGPRFRSRQRLRRLMMAVLLLLLAIVVFYWQPLNSYAVTGASYGARVACSCRYVGNRSLSDCRKDFEPGMEFVRLSEDEDAQSVTARFPLLSSQTAFFRKGEGCMLGPWKD